MAGDGRWVTRALVVVFVAAALSTARVQEAEVRLQLGYVTTEEAELLVVKNNSTASQVVVTLTKWKNSAEYQQQKTSLDPELPSERRTLLFSNLTMDTEYRVCGSPRDSDQQPTGDGQCFSFVTFQERSMSTAVISGIVAAAVVATTAVLLHLLFKAVMRRRNSKTLIVTDGADRERGITNGGAQLSP